MAEVSSSSRSHSLCQDRRGKACAWMGGPLPWRPSFPFKGQIHAPFKTLQPSQNVQLGKESVSLWRWLQGERGCGQGRGAEESMGSVSGQMACFRKIFPQEWPRGLPPSARLLKGETEMLTALSCLVRSGRGQIFYTFYSSISLRSFG